MQPSYEYKINYTIKEPDSVKKEMLTPIDYGYKLKRTIDITIKQPEFTSVCPMTGLPDVGSIIIKYQPDQKIVELKSLKFYLLQYRNVGIFYEHVVNRILDDLVDMLEPLYMEVIGEFTPRGGVSSTASAVYKAVSLT